jgi:hypothetical protein
VSTFISLCVLMLSAWTSVPESLQLVRDDTDIPDKAFNDLINFVRSAAEVDDSVEIKVRHDAILKDPARYRGLRVTVSGRVEQHRSLSRPFEDVEEWFVRDDNGLPWMMYVVGNDEQFADGRQVTMAAYVYKRVQLEDRSGVMRLYPALIGHNPAWLPAASSMVEVEGPQLPWAILLVLIITLVGVLLLGRRIGRRSLARPVIFAEDDESYSSLPGDPSEAMHELKRRGDETTT